MAKGNGNGGTTHLLANLVADVEDLKAEQSRSSDVIDELAEVVARLGQGSRRMEQRLAKMARTVIAFADTIDDHEQRITALERA
jgi:septal ring factor EnvC (AmiA/AmiB activator)